MILQNLKLQRYRNLERVDISWSEHFNVIHGRNAQGKTNLLESIYLLSHLKSFRGVRGREIIQHSAENSWIGASVKKTGVQHKLEIGLQREGRIPKVDGKAVHKLSQFLGYLRTVLFTPEELSNVKGSPAGRRALLDRAILQTDSNYLDRVQEYDRALRQRNRLLKQQAANDQLAPWTESIIRSGARIRHDRIEYLNQFRPQLEQVYKEISGGIESAGFKYSATGGSREELETQLREAFARLADREKKLGVTLAGPHRDDLDFLVDEKSLRLFGSQGQQRSFLLAFKAAQVLDLEDKYKEPPLLLLDDLASELDQERQEGFFNFLLHRRGQVFLTSAQQPQLAQEVKKLATYFRVDQGQVTTITPERG